MKKFTPKILLNIFFNDNTIINDYYYHYHCYIFFSLNTDNTDIGQAHTLLMNKTSKGSKSLKYHHIRKVI